MRRVGLVLILVCSLAGCTKLTGDEDKASSAPALPLIVGDGDGVVLPGDIDLEWNVTTDQPSTVFIEVSYDGGNSWHLVEQNVVNSGSYKFKVPNVAGAEFRLRVIGGENKQVIAESSDISIEGDVTPVELANGGATVYPGQDATINWQTNEDHPTTANVQLSYDNGSSWTTILTTIENDGSASFSVPDSVDSTFLLQVVHPENGLVLARSQPFTIGPALPTGLPGFAISSGGGTISGGDRMIRGVFGEVIQGQKLEDPEGRLRAHVNLLGVTE